ncbi:MAG TPA: hypothetical protein VG962_00535 [Steroidobacteraceae bacterium]|nr:hypothetical protein [Steroidobacteraceae bacterium]
MDAETIKAQRIVERYMSGDLPAIEARVFEKFCQEHPEIVEQFAIPVRMKAKLSAKHFDGTHTSVFTALPSTIERIETPIPQPMVGKRKADDEEDEHEHGSRVGDSRVGRILIGLLVISLMLVGLLYWKTQDQRAQIKTLTAKATSLKIRAPGTTQTFRLAPSESRPVSPQFTVSLAEAKLLEFYLDVSSLHYISYSLTIDKVDEARIVIIRRMVADTNKELRFSLNSSAFGAGDYEFKLEGYNYRGDLFQAGWLMIHME